MSSSFDWIIQEFSNLTAKKSFGISDKVFFFKELWYLLKWWVSIIDAIKTLNESSNNLKLQEITHYIFDMLDNGKSFTYAMSRMNQHFSAGDVAIVKAGESSGRLPEVLWSLASEYGFLNKTQKEYMWAMIYPAVLLILSVVAVFALFIFILPSLFSLVTDFNTEVPFVTRMLMSFSTFLQKNIIYIIIGVVIISLGFSAWFATPHGKNAIYSFIMEVPVIGTITKNYQLIKFSRYMKLMIASWLNYVDIFRLEKEIMTVPIYQRMAEHTLAGVQQGKTMFDGMEHYPDIMPRDVLVLLKVWEETATLDESLDNIVTMYTEDLEIQIRSMSKVIKPVMIVVVWWVIGLVALSVFGIIGSVMDALPNT